MTFGELDEVTLEPERVELSNGMVVYLLEDTSLPLIEGFAYVRAPSLYDPEGKVGLAAMTADLLRTGGAGERSADEVDETLEFLAASVEGSASNNSATVSFSALSDNVDEVLEVFGDVLQRPQFAEERLELSARAYPRTDSPRERRPGRHRPARVRQARGGGAPGGRISNR